MTFVQLLRYGEYNYVSWPAFSVAKVTIQFYFLYNLQLCNCCRHLVDAVLKTIPMTISNVKVMLGPLKLLLFSYLFI